MTDDAVHRYRGMPRARGSEFQLPVPALEEWAARSPRAPCLTTIADNGSETTWTYQEAALATRRLAHALRHSVDVDGRPSVALAPLNDGPSVLTLLALMRLGWPTLLLNPADPPLRRRQQSAALDIGVLLCAPALSGAMPEATPLPVEVIAAGTADAAAPSVHLDGEALYFGTSGSTAASKLVAQSHLNIGANAAGVGQHHGLDSRTRVLSCLPVSHVNALHFTVMATLIAGGHAILTSTFDPLRFPRHIERWAPRIVSVVPSVLDALLRTWRQPRVPDGLEYFLSAAAPLQARTARDVMRQFGRRVLQGYGLTETTNFSTTLPRGLAEDDYRRLMLDCDIPSVGIAIDGNDVAIWRPDGTRAAFGETGEIVMRGHNVMSGYARNDSATTEAFAGGWFHSGDLGRAFEGPAGRTFFVITGRLKNVAKVGGESVSLEEMDRVLCSQPGVEDAACIAVVDPLLGEVIVAAVRSPAGYDEGALRDGLARWFPASVLPHRFVPVASIPRTATGKLRRPELADQLVGS